MAIEHVLAHMIFYIPDPYPHEPRMRTAGVAKESRHVFIVFTFRELEDERYMRPVSAIYARKVGEGLRATDWGIQRGRKKPG